MTVLEPHGINIHDPASIGPGCFHRSGPRGEHPPDGESRTVDFPKLDHLPQESGKVEFKLEGVRCDGPSGRRFAVRDTGEVQAHHGHPAEPPDSDLFHSPDRSDRGKDGQRRPSDERGYDVDL